MVCFGGAPAPSYKSWRYNPYKIYKALYILYCKWGNWGYNLVYN